jgi:hypothetical protein
MKITNFKLPLFNWSSSWGATLNFRLTQIIQNIVFSINRFSDGYLYPSKSITATYSANVSDTVLFGSGTFTITLPSPSVCKDKLFIIKNTGVGTLTVQGITGNVDGAATITHAATVARRYVSDGSNYFTV